MSIDQHPASAQVGRLPVIFTAHSAETAYLKEKICAFVLSRDCVPVNPFMSFGYFLFDLVEKDLIRRANNNLIMRCDELWVFGDPSDGVRAEIGLARSLGMSARYFDIDHHGTRIAESRVGGPVEYRKLCRSDP